MILADNVWHVVSLAVVFGFGLLLCVLVSKSFLVGFLKSSFLYFWHTFGSLGYLFYSLVSVADSTKYYTESLIHSDFGMGTSFVIFFTSIFSVDGGLSYPGVFLVFNVIGSIGLIAFYGSLRYLVADKPKSVQWLAFIAVVLPSVSFWSSAIGKDSIAFMSIGLVTWAAIDLRRRVGLMIFAVVAMLMVRPHMAGILVLALSCALFFDKNASFLMRCFLGSVAIMGAAILVPFAIKYAGLVELSQLAAYVEQRQGYNQGGGSSLDISSMSLPMQMFTYSFRPLPFEAHNLAALLSSMDNLFLILICILGLYSWFRYGVRRDAGNVLFLVAYIGAAWLILAVTTGNLGIAVRQKWMFMPMLIFLCFACIRKIPFHFGRKDGARAEYSV